MGKLRFLLAVALSGPTIRAVLPAYAVPLVAFLLAQYAGVGRLLDVWAWLIVPAVGYHVLQTLSVASNPRLASPIRERLSAGALRLDSGRRGYLTEMRRIHGTILEKLAQSPSAGLRSDLNSMATELDRLIKSLEQLLLKNQAVEDDLKRFERAPYKPDEKTLNDLRALFERQRKVIRSIAQDIATMDANVSLIIHQYDDGNRDAILRQIQDMNGNLSAWRQSVQEVYGN